MANHLEDQEQVVVPAAATEGTPSETPQVTDGNNPQSDLFEEKTVAAEAPEPKAPEPKIAAEPKAVESRTAVAIAPEPKAEGKAPEARHERVAAARPRNGSEVRTNGVKHSGEGVRKMAGDTRPPSELRPPIAESRISDARPTPETRTPVDIKPVESRLAEHRNLPDAGGQANGSAANGVATPPASAGSAAVLPNNQPGGGAFPRRGRHSMGNTGQQTGKNGTTTLDLVELKDMRIEALNQIAKDLGVLGAAGLRKQELIFKILQTQAAKRLKRGTSE